MTWPALLEFEGRASTTGLRACVDRGRTRLGQVVNVVFDSNTAAFACGAVFSIDSSAPVFRDCVFINNSASVSGGAIWVY